METGEGHPGKELKVMRRNEASVSKRASRRDKVREMAKAMSARPPRSQPGTQLSLTEQEEVTGRSEQASNVTWLIFFKQSHWLLLCVGHLVAL